MLSLKLPNGEPFPGNVLMQLNYLIIKACLVHKIVYVFPQFYVFVISAAPCVRTGGARGSDIQTNAEFGTAY